MVNSVVLTCFECHTPLTKPLSYKYGHVESHEDYEGICPVPEGIALSHKTRRWCQEKQVFIFKPTVWVNAGDLLKTTTFEMADGGPYDWYRFCECSNDIGYESTYDVSARYFEPNRQNTYFWPYKQNQKKRVTEIKDKIQADEKSKETFEIYMKESW